MKSQKTATERRKFSYFSVAYKNASGPRTEALSKPQRGSRSRLFAPRMPLAGAGLPARALLDACVPLARWVCEWAARPRLAVSSAGETEQGAWLKEGDFGLWSRADAKDFQETKPAEEFSCEEWRINS